MVDGTTTQKSSADVLANVSVEVRVSVGNAKPTVEQLINLQEDTVLTLDKGIDDPVELFIGDKLIARGQLEEIEGDNSGRLAVRLTAIGDPQAGLQST
jgi:flagellar motor switch protein FliN/FliY